MCGTTISQKGAPGSIPRGGSSQNTGESGTCAPTTEQCSVGIAKVVPSCHEGQGRLQCDELRQTHGKNGLSPLDAIDDAPFGAHEGFEAEEPRVCKGIPIAQGPEEACTCFLGSNVEGDRCAVCAEWMRRCGKCDGCNGHLPGWNVTGILCSDCRDLRLTTKARPSDLGDRVRHLLFEGLEAAWQGLADCPDFDPVTVAACKRLRDMERGL